MLGYYTKGREWVSSQLRLASARGEVVMGRSYLPSRDAELGQWVTNFSTLITASPGTYGLLAGDAGSIAAYVNAFNSALAVVANPATKTRATVAGKDGAKAAMLDIVRPYAIQVRNNAGVSNADKTALGLTIVDQTKTTVPP